MRKKLTDSDRKKLRETESRLRKEFHINSKKAHKAAWIICFGRGA